MAKDRSALDAYLKEAGFARLGSPSGDLLLMEPEASETREVSRSERSVVVTISTRARDRHGDVIDPEGCRLDRFRKNPVVLYAHDYAGLPVAKSLWEKLRASIHHDVHHGDTETRRTTNDRSESLPFSTPPPGRADLRPVPTASLLGGRSVELIAKPQFHLQTELSREVWALVRKGVLSAWSVGFVPEEWHPGPKGKGFVVKRWDLLEYSCVPVPANFEALTHELKERRITAPALVKSLAPLGLREPDLVEHDVRERHGSATEGTESTETGRHDERRAVAGPLPPVSSVPSAADALTSSAAPVSSAADASVASVSSVRSRETAQEKQPAASASDAGKERGGDRTSFIAFSRTQIAAAVGRAFDRALARARGEGFL